MSPTPITATLMVSLGWPNSLGFCLEEGALGVRSSSVEGAVPEGGGRGPLGALLQSSLALYPQHCCCSMMSPTRPPLTASRSVASIPVGKTGCPAPNLPQEQRASGF